jgi:fructokinase
MRYATVLGEALIDLLEGRCDDETVYRAVVGGAPFNVAVGVARLGGAVQFVGSLSTDALGRRLSDFLTANGVSTDNVYQVDEPTTLALTTFVGSEPSFAFYGDSHGRLSPNDLDLELVASSDVLYCGSIAMLREPTLASARSAWAVPGPRKVFDPNARPQLLRNVAAYRAVVEEFAATADLVKLSAADAGVLWGEDPVTVAHRLAQDRTTVVVTRGAAGALIRNAGETIEIEAPMANAVDATGAGDSVMAALIHGLLVSSPDVKTNWSALVSYAVAVAALTVEGRGGATALPTAAAVRARFPQVIPA